MIDEIEQLPRYEAPPPQYERIVKAGPVEMRDLERGESSGAIASRSGPPPGYQTTADAGDGDGGASIRRADTGGSHAGEPPPPPPPPRALFARRVFGGFGLFSR